jgi:hypothetical protein
MIDGRNGCPERQIEPPESASYLFDMAEELRDIRMLLEDARFFRDELASAYTDAFARYQEALYE